MPFWLTSLIAVVMLNEVASAMRGVAQRGFDLELERLPVVGVLHLEPTDVQADRAGRTCRST